ncbi:hypothetical protein PWT90_02960 [Aphanocladium album]|nr:hypothetical protein PWT90_02960 [Aphanocladium album]
MTTESTTRSDAFASLSRDGQAPLQSTTAVPPAPPELLPASTDAMRLSMLAPTRLLLGSMASTMIGFMLGGFQGGQMAQLRFRAEHAHKMPDTTTGWYFYHKSKNYHAMQGGIREGFRMGAKTGFWSFAALSLETTVDRMRGCSDMLSTIVATVSVAGMFSLTRTRLADTFFFRIRSILTVSSSTHGAVWAAVWDCWATSRPSDVGCPLRRKAWACVGTVWAEGVLVCLLMSDKASDSAPTPVLREGSERRFRQGPDHAPARHAANHNQARLTTGAGSSSAEGRPGSARPCRRPPSEILIAYIGAQRSQSGWFLAPAAYYVRLAAPAFKSPGPGGRKAKAKGPKLQSPDFTIVWVFAAGS